MDTKTICLGVLSLGEATGYEIRKLFEEGPFSHFFDAGFGSIYPALNKLLEDGYATCKSETSPGRPTRKIYSITDAGREALGAALTETPAPDKIRSDCLAIMFFGHRLEPERRAHLFDAYCDHFRAALAKLAAVDLGEREFSCKFVHGFGVAIYEAALDYLERNREFFLSGGESDVAKRRAAAGE